MLRPRSVFSVTTSHPIWLLGVMLLAGAILLINIPSPTHHVVVAAPPIIITKNIQTQIQQQQPAHDAELVLAGSLTFRNFLENHQNNCSLPMYSSTSHPYGLFSQLLVLSNTLLEAVSNGYILSWDEAETKYSHCVGRKFDCWFKPITQCPLNPSPVRGRKSCVFDRKVRTGKSPLTFTDVIPTLLKISGLEQLNAPHLFSPHFFLREALLYVMRAKPRLQAIRAWLLRTHLMPLQHVANKDGHRKAIKVAMHVRSGDKKQFWKMNSLEQFVKHVKMRAFLDFGAGIDQLFFTSDDVGAFSKMTQFMNSPYNINDADRMARQASNTLVSFIPPDVFGKSAFEPNAMFQQSQVSTNEQVDAVNLDTFPATVAELLIAQVFIFADEADLFIGSFASNIGIAIHLLMGLKHGTSLPPAFDIAGSPFVPCGTMNAFPLHPLAEESMAAVLPEPT